MNAPLPQTYLPAQTDKPAFELKRLSPRHKQVAALLAQGVRREEIASIVGFRPEYVTMLAKQPLFLEYIQGMNAVVDAQLQTLFGLSVDVMADVMKNGANDERLRAAQMALRANGKEGSVKVNGTVHHKHSLVGILQGLPPAGSPGERDVTIWNAPETSGDSLLVGKQP